MRFNSLLEEPDASDFKSSFSSFPGSLAYDVTFAVEETKQDLEKTAE